MAITQLEVNKREKTKLILSKINNFVSLSPFKSEMLSVLNAPDCDMRKIRLLISKDPALTIKVLSIANSPFYGLTREVSTLDHAVLLVGFDNLKSIVTALIMMDMFKNKNDSYLNHNDFWIHSLITASIGKRFAEDIEFENPERVFIAGLLHDLGIPIMHKYFHSDFINIYKSAEDQDMSFIEAERYYLGYDHQEIAAYLLNSWNLPESLSEAVGNHHDTEAMIGKNKIYSIVYLADYMATRVGMGNCFWDEKNKINEDVLKYLGFTSLNEVDHIIGIYNVMIEKEINALRFN